VKKPISIVPLLFLFGVSALQAQQTITLSVTATSPGGPYLDSETAAAKYVCCRGIENKVHMLKYTDVIVFEKDVSFGNLSTTTYMNNSGKTYYKVTLTGTWSGEVHPPKGSQDVGRI
jgi:hypothetical protein